MKPPEQNSAGILKARLVSEKFDSLVVPHRVPHTCFVFTGSDTSLLFVILISLDDSGDHICWQSSWGARVVQRTELLGECIQDKLVINSQRALLEESISVNHSSWLGKLYTFYCPP